MESLWNLQPNLSPPNHPPWPPIPLLSTHIYLPHRSSSRQTDKPWGSVSSPQTDWLTDSTPYSHNRSGTTHYAGSMFSERCCCAGRLERCCVSQMAHYTLHSALQRREQGSPLTYRHDFLSDVFFCEGQQRLWYCSRCHGDDRKESDMAISHSCTVSVSELPFHRSPVWQRERNRLTVWHHRCMVTLVAKKMKSNIKTLLMYWKKA